MYFDFAGQISVAGRAFFLVNFPPKSLQMEWTIFQQVMPNVSAFFGSIEDAIKTDFLPALLAGGMDKADEAFRKVSCFPVWYVGLGIPNPVLEANRQYNTLLEMT